MLVRILGKVFLAVLAGTDKRKSLMYCFFGYVLLCPTCFLDDNLSPFLEESRVLFCRLILHTKIMLTITVILFIVWLSLDLQYFAF